MRATSPVVWLRLSYRRSGESVLTRHTVLELSRVYQPTGATMRRGTIVSTYRPSTFNNNVTRS